MGTELGPWREWNHDTSLDWHLADDPFRAGLDRFLEDLGRIYHARPALWREDHEPSGFSWIDCSDRAGTVLAYVRRCRDEDPVVIVLNLTPVPRDDYRVGAPAVGRWTQLLTSDDARYAGSGYPTALELDAEPVPFHGLTDSLRLRLPPLGALVLAPSR
jgi:1,4-alpha-glucan branching enzyme